MKLAPETAGRMSRGETFVFKSDGWWWVCYKGRLRSRSTSACVAAPTL